MVLSWEMAGGLMTIGGIIFHAGVLHEKVRKQREDHDALDKYAHSISHQTISHISDEINHIKMFLFSKFPDAGGKL